MPPHCPQCTDKHQPGPAWHGEFEGAQWTPLTSSPCHPGSGPPPLLPRGPRFRIYVWPQLHYPPNWVPSVVSFSQPQSPYTGLAKKKFFPSSIHPSIFLAIHDFNHLSTHPSFCLTTRLFTNSSMYPTIHLLLLHLFIHSPIHSSNHLSSF